MTSVRCSQYFLKFGCELIETSSHCTVKPILDACKWFQACNAAYDNEHFAQIKLGEVKQQSKQLTIHSSEGSEKDVESRNDFLKFYFVGQYLIIN